MDIRVYWIWLQQVLEVGGEESSLILERFTSPEEVYALSETEAAQIGLSEAASARLANRSLNKAQQTLSDVLQSNGWMLTPGDGAYPLRLRGIFAPPLVLYGQGEIPNFERQPAIALVGTREADLAGITAAAGMAAGIVAGGGMLISGSAPGVDAAALEGGLRQGRNIVSVQACGLDNSYPYATWELRQAILQRGGTLLSEYPPGTEVRKESFRVRNRLLAGLSVGVCVINAPERSGALITAGWAREQGRDLYAVPGDTLTGQNDGTNRLIQEGARLVSQPGDILRDYRFRFEDAIDLDAAHRAYTRELVHRHKASARADEVEIAVRPKRKPAKSKSQPSPPSSEPPTISPPPCPAGLSEMAMKIYGMLSVEPRAVDEIATQAGFEVGETLAVLTELELQGCVESGAGQRYNIHIR